MSVIVQNKGTYLVHAWDANTQRLNYDAQARHERYIRDRDAGKTGYQGIQGQSALNSHDPTRQSYLNRYGTNRKSGVIARRSSDLSRSSDNSARVNRSISKNRQRALNRNRISQESDLNLISSEQFKTISSIRQQINMLQNLSSADKKKNKEEIKQNISIIKDKIEQTSSKVRSILEQRQGKTKKQIEITKEKSKSKISKEAQDSIDKMKSKNDSLYNENSKIRERLNKSNLSSKKEQELRSKIADNAKKILENHEKYTNKINSVKTSHTEKMNEDLSNLSKELQAYLTQNKDKQKNSESSLKSQIQSLRDSNSREISRIKSEIESRTSEKQTSINKTISKSQEKTNKVVNESRNERESIEKRTFKQKSTNEGRDKVNNEFIKKNAQQKLSEINESIKKKK